MILLAWISAIFPSTTGELNKYLAYSKKLCNLSFSNRAFLHQLQRIYFLRESDSSDESIEDLEMISLLTNETISFSTTFWSIAANNTDELNSSIFTGIAYATKTAQVKWSEILEKYPNNYIFAQEYSRYLIDAECKFNEGTNWLIKSNIMEKTQKSFVDNMFKSFLHTFPFYLKDGIVNTSGKLLPGTANIILEKLDIFEISDSLSDFYATSTDSSIESLTKGEANKILPKGEIRLTMEKALNTVGIPISTKLRFAAIFRLVFTFGYAIGITIWIIFSYGSNKILFKDILLLSNVIDDFERMSINLANLFFSSYSQKYEKENQDYLFYNDSNKALIDLSNFMDQLYSNNDKEDLILFNRIFSSSLVDTVECSILDTLKPIYKEMGSTPDFQLRGFIYETLILMVNSDVEKQHWLFDTNFCNSYHGNYGNQKTILNLFTYLSPSWKGVFNGGFKAMTSDIIKNRTSSLLSSSPVSLFGVYTTNNTKKIASQSDKSDSFSGLSLLELTLSEIFAKRTTNQEDTFDFQIMQEIDQSFAFNFFRSFSPIAIGCISLPALILMASAIIHVKESFCNYLIRVSNEEMKKASKFLIAKESKGPVPTARMNTHSYRNLSWIWNMIMAIIVIVLFIVQSFYGLVNYNDHLIITQHTIFSILQRSLIYELARDTLYSVFFYQLENEGFHTSEGHINNSPISSYDVNFKQVEYDLKIYETLELLMEEGYDDHLIPRINNYNDKIDEFKENEKCTLASKFYQCLSFNRLLSYFKNQIKEIHHSPQLFSIESDEILYLIDIVNERFSNDFLAIINLYENQFEEVNTLNIVIVMIFFIAIMILAIASYLVENITLSIFDREFKAFKTLILRVDPVYFVSNPELIELFYNRKNEKMISSSSHAAFYASHDAMISVNIDLVIENVNPAVTDVFGFTPEQVLGQDLNFLISYQINKRLYSVFDLMKSGETSLVFECDANGNTDDSKGVPLHLSVIGFKNESGLVTTFAVLMKDMTEEEKQRLAVEEAKKQAELILLQILPKDIIIRLNRGDKNIDFTVKSSTIIFIDIEKFSEYSATLSTKDIMLNLSKIFTVFDKICSTFNLITKIKLIGDDYMAAAGLFTPEIIPVRHALQMIQFALQCLEALEELNVLLNSSLQVRIGINTDGPLIAGVLGTDKPMFDIIGDPINVAARLQSTCIPGLVQISESTYNLVANMDFNIEERGEIELKGKGKRKTFLIHPEIKRDSRSSIFMLDDDVSSSVLKQLYDQQAQKSSTIKNKK